MTNDLISRSALKRDLIDRGFYPVFVKCALETAPAVDAEPVKHGRWVRYKDDRFMGYDTAGKSKYRKVYTYECNNCGNSTAVKSNYCPNCGAKMDLEG